MLRIRTWASATTGDTCTYSFSWTDATSNCSATTTTTNLWAAYQQPHRIRIAQTWAAREAPGQWRLAYNLAPQLRIDPGADQVAEALLRRHLSAGQLGQLQAHGFFDVERPGRTYRIHRGRSINIQVLEAGRTTHRLCFHPGAPMPDADTMLAQKLMLEANEQEALRIAIRHAA